MRPSLPACAPLAPLLLLAGCTSTAAVAAEPPGSYLIVLEKDDARMAVVEPNSGHVKERVPTGRGPHEAACSLDGRWVVVANYGDRTPGSTLTVYDMAERLVDRTIDLAPHQRPHGITFLDQRTRVLVTSETSRAVLVVDIRTGRVDRVLDTGAAASHMLALAPDKQHVYTANIADDSVSRIALASGELVNQARTGARPEGLAITPDGRELWVGHNEGHEIVVLDAATLDEKERIPCPGMPIRVEITWDGRLALAACAQSGELAIFDVATRRPLERIDLKEGGAPAPVPVGIQIDPRSRTAFVAETGAGRVAAIDLAERRILARIPLGNGPDGMCWSWIRRPPAFLDG